MHMHMQHRYFKSCYLSPTGSLQVASHVSLAPVPIVSPMAQTKQMSRKCTGGLALRVTLELDCDDESSQKMVAIEVLSTGHVQGLYGNSIQTHSCCHRGQYHI
jgi:hypothetical protein